MPERTAGEALDVAQADHGGAQAAAVESFECRHHPKLRSIRKPEPYKGKGVRFVGEVVRKKAGKSASV